MQRRGFTLTFPVPELRPFLLFKGPAELAFLDLLPPMGTTGT